MKKHVISLLIVTAVFFYYDTSTFAMLKPSDPTEDSYELKIQDILMLLLGEDIERAVNHYYEEYLTESPSVYPYQVDIAEVERVEGFRSFHFRLTLELTPVVGPHIPVGKDRLTFEISPIIPDDVKLTNFEHIETYELPPHWQHLILQK
ncbi:DUF3888 domain-containing protein [Oceanobacillus kapialis]|uniref:DUF3888 domain-containing protein n=1 Tax=Oceanobacillus kapialis TaxID=481353 RepID=A0ABW5Q291_9BACI